MEFSYKCPVCRANNILNTTNQQCRRCESDLSSIYNLKKREIFKILKALLRV